MRTSGLAGGDAPSVEGDILGQPEENSMSGSATESVRSDWNSQARAWFDQRERDVRGDASDPRMAGEEPRPAGRAARVGGRRRSRGYRFPRGQASRKRTARLDRPVSGDGGHRAEARGRAGNSERRLSRARRAGDGPRRRVVRRRALPLGLHAHARPRGRATRVQAGARAGRTSRVRRFHRPRGEPVRVPAGANADGARASSPPDRRLAARAFSRSAIAADCKRCSTVSASRPRASSRSRWRGTSRTRTPIGIFSSS